MPAHDDGMTLLLTLIAGFLLGYLGTVPAAGPLAVWIMRAALNDHMRELRLLAIGGALAEALWVCAAAFGLGWVLTAYPELDLALSALGIAIALVCGVVLLRIKPSEANASAPQRRGTASGLALGFALVAFNPSFFATWVVSCAMLRAHPRLAGAVTDHAPWLALSAAIGVVAWYLTLARLIARHREALSARRLLLTRLLGGVLIIGAGLGLLSRLR